MKPRVFIITVVAVIIFLYFVQLNKAIAKEQQKNNHLQEEIVSFQKQSEICFYEPCL
ncbi:hypothetical protein [Bacillus sp. AFS018417]|uniref:hypothetical protein n=1 Tax=Bacillus sp. AFS018417 TaxID=2033491 RepID=UPI001596E272|nr:hypothetical protein [Bacillus sp. AFS018417]